MNKISNVVALFGFLFFASIPVTHAQSADGGINVAVIDINFIAREGQAFKGIREQIAKYRQVFQGEIQKEEEALRSANQEIARQRALLSQEAFAEKRKEFEVRVAGVQRLVQQRKLNLDRAQAEAMGKIQKVLNEIVTNMAKEFNISLILRQEQTVLVAPIMQITKQVLDRLDAQLPSVTVSEPAQ